MTYVVVENCIKCKYMDCVEVCPVDCFYEGDNMLVIHPDECIDCGVCEPECPADAIKPDTEPGLEKWLELNAEYAKTWPNITVKSEAPADAKEWDGSPGQIQEVLFGQSGHWRLGSTALTTGRRLRGPQRNRCLAAPIPALTGMRELSSHWQCRFRAVCGAIRL